MQSRCNTTNLALIFKTPLELVAAVFPFLHNEMEKVKEMSR